MQDLADLFRQKHVIRPVFGLDSYKYKQNSKILQGLIRIMVSEQKNLKKGILIRPPIHGTPFFPHTLRECSHLAQAQRFPLPNRCLSQTGFIYWHEPFGKSL